MIFLFLIWPQITASEAKGADAMQSDELKKSNSANKQFLTELTMAFVQQLDANNTATLFRVLRPQFTDSDGTLQKKVSVQKK